MKSSAHLKNDGKYSSTSCIICACFRFKRYLKKKKKKNTCTLRKQSIPSAAGSKKELQINSFMEAQRDIKAFR